MFLNHGRLAIMMSGNAMSHMEIEVGSMYSKSLGKQNKFSTKEKKRKIGPKAWPVSGPPPRKFFLAQARPGGRKTDPETGSAILEESTSGARNMFYFSLEFWAGGRAQRLA